MIYLRFFLSICSVEERLFGKELCYNRLERVWFGFGKG